MSRKIQRVKSNQETNLQPLCRMKMTYTKGFRTALHPLHFIGSYGRGAGIFSIRFSGVYLVEFKVLHDLGSKLNGVKANSR